MRSRSDGRPSIRPVAAGIAELSVHRNHAPIIHLARLEDLSVRQARNLSSAPPRRTRPPRTRGHRHRTGLVHHPYPAARAETNLEREHRVLGLVPSGRRHLKVGRAEGTCAPPIGATATASSSRRVKRVGEGRNRTIRERGGLAQERFVLDECAVLLRIHVGQAPVKVRSP